MNLTWRLSGQSIVQRKAAQLVVGLTLTIVLAIMILSFDRIQTSLSDAQTENAYVGGEVTLLSARVSGYLIRLPIQDNQVVRAGELIAQVEDTDYLASADQAKAQVAAARARLEALDAQLQQVLQQTEQARTGEAAAIADLSQAVPELRRQKLLLGTDVGQQRALDVALADRRRFDAQIKAARARVTVRERQADELVAQRRQAQAALLARQADLRLAEITLGWTRVVAPLDGTLGPRLVREGTLLAAGTRLVVLTPLKSVWVDANFTERQLPYIRPGQTVRLVLDAFPDQPLAGHVVSLAPTTGGALSAISADNTTGNFTKVAQRVPVRIAIDWSQSPLQGLVRPGMSVTATIHTTTAPRTMR